MRITGLWRYPVASFGGEWCAQLDLAPAGVRGDRALVAVRTSDGTVAAPEASSEWARAPFAQARGDCVEVRVSSKDWQPAGDRQAAEDLAQLFGFEVALKTAVGFNRPTLDDRSVPVRAPRQPLHIITEQQMARLRLELPDSLITVDRFRPNVVVDASPLECEQFAAAEGTLEIDDCRIELEEQTLRCAFPALSQPGLPRDTKLLKHLRQAYGLRFGVGCRILTTGVVRLGDELSFV